MSGTSPVADTWSDLPATTAERLGTVRAALGEGPTWDADREALWWIDIQGRRLHLTRLDGSDTDLAVARPLGSVVLRASGGLMGGTPEGFVAIDPDDGSHGAPGARGGG